MNILINGESVRVEGDDTVFSAAQRAGIEIPALCRYEGYDNGVCRLCMVELEGVNKLQPACTTIVSPQMKVDTESERVIRYRKSVLSLYMEGHGDHEDRSEEKCLLHEYASQYDVRPTRKVEIVDRRDESHPAINFDPDLCIDCRKCVIACNSEQSNEVISIIGRGKDARIGFDDDVTMGQSSCVSCGACVDVCPTGALIEKSWEPAERTVQSTCPYCAVGCQIEYGISGERVVWARGITGMGINNGKLCVKGKFGFEFQMSADRLLKPLIRKDGVEKGALNGRSVDQVFREATWDEALDLMVGKIKDVRDRHGSDAIAGIASDRSTNEDVYAFQKLMRAVVNTDNLDQSATLCHSPSAAMLSWALGAGAATNPVHDVSNSRTIMVVGSNTDRAHPVISSFIKKAAKEGAYLIVVDPRNIELARRSDLFLQLRPGTDVFLFSAMAKYILDNNLADRNYIEAHSEGFPEFLSSLRQFDMKEAERITGICAADIEKAARTYALSKPSSIFWTLGITEHVNGSDNVSSLVNLAILTGNLGIPGGGLNPIRGQNNVQGGADVGGTPGSLPGYQDLMDQPVREKFERVWKTSLPEKRGLKSTEMINEALSGSLKMMYISGENSIRTHPNTHEVDHALRNLEFLVVQDIFLNETAEYADVILPAASSLEEFGTFTNTERRVQIVRPLLPPPGEARADWEIYADISRRLGYDMGFNDSGDIMDEIATLAPSWAGISHERLAGKGMQWPVVGLDSQGTEILHENSPMRGKARFRPLQYNRKVDDSYPYVIITGRRREHYHTDTMTSRSGVIRSVSTGSSVEMNAGDMEREGIREGSMVRLVSDTGNIEARAVSSDTLPPGVMFTTFHFTDLKANVLTSSTLDPITKTPAYKDTRVRVEKL